MPTSTTQPIPDDLIESSLDLCGKTMEDMNKITLHRPLIIKESFSIERFCYYLLSLEFIEKYWSEYLDGVDWMAFPENLAHSIGESVYRYQSWDAEPLISLLSKI